ncbi:B12-binding domain-containing radical SAM protein [Pendulispora albinea]|uniref:Cobalamin-dependent protein n=1 Tax=Pendulispora albinea TaxID=2741071 RepID=A0ABZ2LMR1_9BACT
MSDEPKLRTLLISANREMFPSPVVPIGVLAIAGAIRDAHDVRVLDLCFAEDPHAEIEAAIAQFDPQVVGLALRNLNTNAYSDEGTQALLREYTDLARTIRAHTQVPLVLGGAGYSLRPEGLLTRLGADIGVVGEGERAFRQIVDTLARGGAVPRIVHGGGVVHSQASGIQLRRSAEIVSDLDLLPPIARDLVDPRYYAYTGTDNIQTKRGCAFGCTYCDYPDLEGRKVRVRSPARVADEVLERSRTAGVSFAFFVDSVFNVPPKAALQLCHELIARGSPLSWCCYGTPAAFDDELVEAMVRAGCCGVEVGSDSGTERMLKLLKKPFRIRDIVRTRELFVRHGLLDSHTFVLGAEDETPDEVRRSLEFVDRLDPDVAVFVVYTEDREAMTVGRAQHRESILRLLADVAPNRSGWVVPELGIRSVPRPKPTRGPAWLEYARHRRGKAEGAVAT